MTVAEMLSRITSYELTEWEAYEMANGPLGPEYEREALATIVDQLQISNYMFGSQAEDNPIPEPTRFPRPVELSTGLQDRPQQDQGTMSVDEYVSTQTEEEA